MVQGSAADSRILRDALTRQNGLQVPKGHYYLCDNGYANSEGFLTPYKVKMRWGILRSTTFYPMKTQNRLIMSCFILNNFIRAKMPNDPIEHEFDNATTNKQDDVEFEGEFIDGIESSPLWNAERDAIAQAMWLNYLENI
ncbi:uncharacterized protein LOC130998596 [Salvia miltiorrhiza]|uniref:uncharacterized protein LOC130998596 n=1 Tax=Salvia miltiorrhiza TaxID=226208 RepID=UPI0025ACB0D5|nr:uncharacterized protein LOC130998596 [Salvia miltiorrhiza]